MVRRAGTIRVLDGQIETFYGWKLTVNSRTKERTIRNFRVQGDGAEILRLACIFLWESGVRVCAPVHDAVLVECNEGDLEDVVHEVQHQMERASEHVLDGYRLRTEAQLLRLPGPSPRPQSKGMWDRIMAIAGALRQARNGFGHLGNRCRYLNESGVNSHTPVPYY